MFIQKRRDFIVGSATLLITCGLKRLRWSSVTSSANGQERIRHNILYVGGPNASHSNPGTSAAPFATIQMAADVATPGTEVRIRDGIYRETVTPAVNGTAKQPIIFTADTRQNGSLCEPVVSGAELITTEWALTTDQIQNTGNNIYETTITLPRNTVDAGAITGNATLAANQIFIRSKMAHLAAWPKKQNQEDLLDTLANFVDVTRRMETGSLTPSNLDNCYTLNSNSTRARWTEPTLPSVNWSGGYLFAAHSYMPYTLPIINYGSGFVEVDIGSLRTSNAGHMAPIKFFTERESCWLMAFGVKELLTAENEWYYDGSTNKLYLWAPGGGVPGHVEYKARNWGFDLTDRSHVQLKHLNFFACEITQNGSLCTASDTQGILIDFCRFKYVNHWEVKPWPMDMRLVQLPTAALRPYQNPYNNETGIRMTAANSTIRNSVIKQSAGDLLYLSGDNVTVENCYLSDAGYRGGYSAAVNVSVPNPCTITRNTFRRTYRSAINHIGYYKDISYNDFAEYMCVSNDGGGIYSAGRWEGRPPGAPGAIRGGEAGGQKVDGTLSGSFKGTVIHHNWFHSPRMRHRWQYGDNPTPYQQSVAPGVYLDANGDGAIVHHNVFWDNNDNDAMPSVRNEGEFPPYANSSVVDPATGELLDWYDAGKWNRFYNNTFATEGTSTRLYEWKVGANASNTVYPTQYINYPDTINNNIYMQRPFLRFSRFGPEWVDPEIKSTELSSLTPPYGTNENPLFTNPGTIENRPLGDQQGLGFQLQENSPARNRGVPINGTLDNEGNVIDFVDDYDGDAPDCGAYEFGREPWIPGCTLEQEFIDGEPWEQQWDA